LLVLSESKIEWTKRPCLQVRIKGGRHADGKGCVGQIEHDDNMTTLLCHVWTGIDVIDFVNVFQPCLSTSLAVHEFIAMRPLAVLG